MRLVHILSLLLFLAGAQSFAIDRPEYGDLIYARNPQEDDSAATDTSAPTGTSAPTDASAPTDTTAVTDASAPTDTSAPTDVAAASTEAASAAATTSTDASSAAASTTAASTTCADPDVTSNPQAIYQTSNAGQLIIDGLTALGSPANFPQALVGMITSPPVTTFDCSNLQDGTNCVLPKGPDGTACSAFTGSNQQAAVIVVDSYINMYMFLQNSFSAVQVAHDEIAASKFLEFMRNDITPGKDLLGQILLQVLEIAISFIPIGGIEIAAIKAAVKVFKKLAEKTIKSAQKQGNTNSDPPPLSDLVKQLDALVPAFQGAIVDQHTQIFKTANPGADTNNPQFVWLDGGVQLALTVTKDQLKQNMVTSMKNFMLSSYMVSFNAQVVRASAADVQIKGVNCNKPTEISRPDRACDCFGYPGQSVFAGKLEGSQPVKDITLTESKAVFGGIQFPDIIENAIACSASGGNISNVNAATFLDNPTTTVPDCLFGFPVRDINTIKEGT